MTEPSKGRARIGWRDDTDAKPGALVVVDCALAALGVALFALSLVLDGPSWLTALWFVLGALFFRQAVFTVRSWRRSHHR